MKILLTNDDGVDAPGIQALFDSVTHAIERHRPDQPYQIVVVAPDRCRSECSHSIETNRPLTFKTVRADWYSVDGTPVDCIRVSHYAMDFCPDIVFSGINAGANLGVNLFVSGTFAAAREASLLGIPAMAASHYRRPDVPTTWDHTPRWLAETIEEFFVAAGDHRTARHSAARHSAGKYSAGKYSAGKYSAGRRPAVVSKFAPPLWNVNLPAVDPVTHRIPPRTVCKVDRCPIDCKGTIEDGGRVRFELDFHARPREEGRDVESCFNGQITISKLNAHRTD